MMKTIVLGLMLACGLILSGCAVTHVYTGAPPASPSKSADATPAPTAAQPAPKPIFSQAEASSVRSSEQDQYGTVYTYEAANVMDGNIATCWATNPRNDSQPSVTLRASDQQHVSGIQFSNGYFRNQETYEKNARITKVRIYYEGGWQDYQCSANQYRMMQTVTLPQPADTSYITLQVLEWTAGDWEDICISSIEIF